MRSSFLLLASLLTFQAASVQIVPPQPARDTVRRSEPTGTGVIRGRVMTADTGMPVRRAMVNLSWTEPPRAATPPAQGSGSAAVPAPGAQTAVRPASGPFQPIRPRETTTDAQGAFEFTNLPAGTYRISAFPGQFAAQYIGLAYGAKRPMLDPGLPIPLSAGAVFDRAIIALPRGAVITGRVTDEDGAPLARVQVYGLFFQPGSSRGQRNNSGGNTDDLGQFRLYGLQPGEYAVAAEARMPTFVSPNMVQSSSEEDRIGFMTTFFPGTPDEATAQRIRATSGTETGGIEIRMVSGRLLRVSGMVSDSQGKPLASAMGQVMRRTAGAMGMANYGFSTDGQGRFAMRNVPPGNYRVVVRQRPMNFAPDGSSMDPGEVAVVPFTLADSDIDDLMIVTSQGATVKGQVIFEHGVPSPIPTQMRIITVASEPDYGGMSSGSALVQPDLTFTLKGIVGEFVLRAGGPGLYLKSVTAGAEDITDTPREFKSGERVTVTMTSRASSVEGTITDLNGAVSSDCGVVLFSEDKSSWRSTSIRTRRASPDANGHFQLNGLVSGRYYIIAAPRTRLNMPPGTDSTFFEALSKDALAIVVGEDEQRTVDLKIVGGGV